MALIEAKLTEHPGVEPQINVIKAGIRSKRAYFTVEFINVSHSIDDAMGLAITTPIGVLVHTGDFKIDLTPACGEVMELSRFADLGKRAYWP